MAKLNKITSSMLIIYIYLFFVVAVLLHSQDLLFTVNRYVQRSVDVF